MVLATVKMVDGVVTWTRKWRLQNNYPVYMAELVALGRGVRQITAGHGVEVNLATGSRVALDLLGGRKRGLVDGIDRRMREIEEAGIRVTVWWVSDSFASMKAADEASRSVREEPAGISRVQAPVTRRKAQKATMERW